MRRTIVQYPWVPVDPEIGKIEYANPMVVLRCEQNNRDGRRWRRRAESAAYERCARGGFM